jgi:beta-lactamase class A
MRVLLFAVLIACGSSSPKPALPPPPPPVAPAPPAKATYPGVPQTTAGEHLAWLLDAIANKQGEITIADAEKRLHTKFLAQVPATQFVEVTKGLVALNPIEVTAAKGTDLELVARLKTARGPLLALVSADPVTKQIEGLLFRPDTGDIPQPKTFEEALDMTSKLAPKAQLLVAALDKGTCKPLHATASKEQLAIGSTFKLWVLLALADKVIAGKAKWSDEVAVRDDWKSPPGPVNDDAAGTKLTLQAYAERMISVSDNAATDHLFYTLGRKAIEAAMRSTKHASPARNIPMFSTRELTIFKLGTPDDEIEKYLKKREPQRRAHLDGLAGKPLDLSKAAEWTTGRRIDQLEWFANTDDLCRAMGTLWQRAQKDAAKPVLDVLSKRSGIEIDKTAFPYVGYKGGGEPGVMNVTFLVRRADDKWFVVSLTANAPGATVDAPKLVGVVQGVFALLKSAP